MIPDKLARTKSYVLRAQQSQRALRANIKKLRAEIVELKRREAFYCEQLRELGYNPDWVAAPYRIDFAFSPSILSHLCPP